MEPAGIYTTKDLYEPFVWADPKVGTWFFGYDRGDEPEFEPESPNEFWDGDWDHRIGDLLIPMKLWRW